MWPQFGAEPLYPLPYGLRFGTTDIALFQEPLRIFSNGVKGIERSQLLEQEPVLFIGNALCEINKGFVGQFNAVGLAQCQ